MNELKTNDNDETDNDIRSVKSHAGQEARELIEIGINRLRWN